MVTTTVVNAESLRFGQFLNFLRTGENAESLRYGQFLTFITSSNNGEKLPSNLSESRFRGYWSATSKADNDRKRYLDVITGAI